MKRQLTVASVLVPGTTERQRRERTAVVAVQQGLSRVDLPVTERTAAQFLLVGARPDPLVQVLPGRGVDMTGT